MEPFYPLVFPETLPLGDSDSQERQIAAAPANQRGPMSALAVAPVLVTEQTQSSATSARSLDNQAFTHEQIAKLAYSLWERRGCPENSADADWLEAEQQVRNGTAE